MTIAERLALLRRDIDAEVRRCGRAPGSVKILGVSKRQPVSSIVEAAGAGLRDVGENYVQEARAKLPELERALDRNRVRLHFIGHVQTNKARQIAQTFDVVQSVDRPDAATALGAAAERLGKRLTVLLQLNISPAERFGCAPSDAERLADLIRAQEALTLDGVMAIGPITPDESVLAQAFSIAAKTFGRIGGNTLSIGMSADWREAVRAGSTMVRIGTALFGPRAP
jgi:pyridoxal phosphate enzyme (YggS family)